MSFRFLSSDCQKLFWALLLTEVLELLPPPAAAPPAALVLVDAIWVLIATVPLTSRDILT